MPDQVLPLRISRGEIIGIKLVENEDGTYSYSMVPSPQFMPLNDAAFAELIGEATATPSANTVLGRLKALLSGIVISAGTAIMGKVGIDQTTNGATNAVAVRPRTSATMIASQTDTISASNTFSTPIEMIEYFNFSLSGTWAGIITLQRKRTGEASYLDVTTYSSNFEDIGLETEGGTLYRWGFKTGARVSGSAVGRLSR